MIRVRQVTPEEYAASFAEFPHVFNTVGFSMLNAYKCSRLHFILFSDTRLRAGIILGENDMWLCSPFSAPFGGLTLNRDQHISTVDEIFAALLEYASGLGRSLRITLPPMWHNPGLISQCVSSLSRLPGSQSVVDLCYHIPLCKSDVMLQTACSRARGSLKQALSVPFMITCGGCTPQEITRAYGIIKHNHDLRGFPVRMDLDDMIRTSAFMRADTFVLSLDGVDVAAAIVFETLSGVAQPVIWGDDVEHHSMRTMHRLCYEIAGWYAARGFHTLDLGPSTESGRPNYGLCFFKKSLGFTPSLRYTFTVPVQYSP